MHISRAELHERAVQYCFERGRLVPILRWDQLQANSAIGRHIARLFEAAPKLDERALPEYRALRDDIHKLFDSLIRRPSLGGLGIEVLVHSAEPYRSGEELVAELCEHGRVRVDGGTIASRAHPFLTVEARQMLAAVYRTFGHVVANVGFDAHGQEAAWLRCSLMFSPLGRRAMTTETRAQNCALRYTSGAASVPQPKVMLLPPKYSDPDYEAWR